jgi:hypothetical protein
MEPQCLGCSRRIGAHEGGIQLRSSTGDVRRGPPWRGDTEDY